MLKNFAVNMLNVDTCRKGIVSTSKFVTEVFKKYQKHFENAMLGKEMDNGRLLYHMFHLHRFSRSIMSEDFEFYVNYLAQLGAFFFGFNRYS